MTLRIALTPGEPAGIGPDLAIMLAQHSQVNEIVVFGDPGLLTERARLLKLPLRLVSVNLNQPPSPLKPGELGIVPQYLSVPSQPGRLNPQNGKYLLQCLDAAMTSCRKQDCHAVVTGPIQKSVINQAGIPFSGHTEYFAEKLGRKRVVMMLATEGLRVALATTHLPLKNVPDAINEELLTDIITILQKDLINKFGIARPRILVCGLNPHAGEDGHLGDEEIQIIRPALKKLQQEGINCLGPYPADTVFTHKHLKGADAIVAMYHDQGLPVLKHMGFGHAANITLGLPIIRTSVDHGTALDLVGTGTADLGSLKTAIDAASQMAKALLLSYA